MSGGPKAGGQGKVRRRDRRPAPDSDPGERPGRSEAKTRDLELGSAEGVESVESVQSRRGAIWSVALLGVGVAIRTGIERHRGVHAKKASDANDASE